MDAYTVSKAWHIGHELAIDIHKLAKQLPAEDKFNLEKHLRRTSAAGPLKLAESLEKKLLHEKLHCYHAAREAMIELHEHLIRARDHKYIERDLFQELASRAISVQRLLSFLIRKTKQDIMTATE